MKNAMRLLDATGYSAIGGPKPLEPLRPLQQINWGHFHSCNYMLYITAKTSEAFYSVIVFSANGSVLLQRAKNGVLDPLSLDLPLGRPRFLRQITRKPFKTRVLGPLD